VRLRERYAAFDAERKFGVPNVNIADPKSCQCGEVLKGVIKPRECKVFGTACTPETPLGSLMVSSEGACGVLQLRADHGAGAGHAERRRVSPGEPHINLSHGSGGKAMRRLIEEEFVPAFDNPALRLPEDQATIPLAELARHGDQLAFTTDSYVVDPLFFPGGDIGSLAIAGTVNDLAMSGARPLFLSCGMVLEEGLNMATLRRVVASMKRVADEAGVAIATGDTKVVERGAADKLFINTSGIGVVPAGVTLSARNARPGDVVIVSGLLGDHGAAILIARKQLALDADIESDRQPLDGLVLASCPTIRCLRDATRGGVATVLNEFAQSSGVAIRVRETALPVREQVKGACEILGLDPLYLANEGKLVAVVPEGDAGRVLDAMRSHAAGADAAIIGEICAQPAGIAVLHTGFGGERIVDTLIGEQLPRIC
jgi:hydrogenase expression/formation protein HypE